MIVVFVVDTSPNMAEPANSANAAENPTKARGISRLDVAKMSVESMARSMDKRIVEHNRSVVMASAQAVASSGSGAANIEVGRLEQFDEFLLLSTSLQPDLPSSPRGDLSASMGIPSADAIAAAAEAHVACGAGGRLLVGCVESLADKNTTSSMVDATGNASSGRMLPHPPDRADFERELKRLRSAIIPTKKHSNNSEKNSTSFPDWAGGAVGLNAALSHGLGLLSRYRLTRGRIVEHFGMGRLPWFEHVMTKLTKEGNGEDPNANNVIRNDSPLQPACLVLLTDGECLRLPPEKGGGGLRLQFGNIPLREFYREPFRWDQRIFIIHIGDSSTPPLHQSLRALCEVTGGAYMKVNPSESSLTNMLSRIYPPRPKPGSIPNPLRLPSMPPERNDTTNTQIISSSNIFANGGPVCGFQSMDCVGEDNNPSLHRAMIMFAGSCEQTRWILSVVDAQQQPVSTIVQKPIWCIPEPYFPSKKLDTLPPRPSQPLLHYTRTYQAVGSPVFDPLFVMKALHHLDQLQVSIRQSIIDAGENPPPITNRMLQRDVYICDWLGGQESASKNNVPGPFANATGAPRIQPGREHFPVCVRGAGRPTISGEGGDHILNIGILHVPYEWIRMKDFVSKTSKSATPVSNRLSTLTLLPPDPHILIPLLIRVAEMELRVLKKTTESNKDKAGSRGGATAGLIKKKVNSVAATKAIHLDDNWKSDFRAYIFRLPPYYYAAIRKVLLPMLPPSVLSLLPDNQEPLPSLCFSRACLMKIKNGEQLARDGNDWLRSIERDLRQRKSKSAHDAPVASTVVMSSTYSVGGGVIEPQLEFTKSKHGQFDPQSMTEHSYKESLRSLPPPRIDKIDSRDGNSSSSPYSVLDILNDLPSSCLLPYYESRRRWIFGGGTSLTTRGLHVDGVNNDGVNTQHFSSNEKVDDEPLIALARVGADTMNQKKISEMGDFKERLAFNRVPLVGYGGSNASGSAVTTAADGSPTFTADDEVFPLNFFDPKTGEFIDNCQIRAKARQMINFGNPFREKRGDSIVPENFASQRPPSHVGENGTPMTPPGSPPHDTYDSPPIEDEGEAAFTGKRPASPPRSPRHSALKDLNFLLTRDGKRKKTNQDDASEKIPEKSSSALIQNDKTKQKVSPRPSPLTSTSQPPPPRPPPPDKEKKESKPSAPPPISMPMPPKRPSQSNVPKSRESSDQPPRKPPPPKKQNSRESSSGSNLITSQIKSTKLNQTSANNVDIAKQLQTPDEKPKVDLPPGWMCVWSKSQKRWYFFDTRTNKSVWEWPPPGGAI